MAVEINGKQVATFDSDDVGKGKLIPTSPGDELTVVDTDDSRSVLLSKTIDDRDEIGDFIAHYTFEDDDSEDVLEDQAKDNDGEIHGDPDWEGDSMTFHGGDHGSGDWIEVDDVSNPDPEQRFTIAVTYRQDSTDVTQQLVEHSAGGDEWAIQTWPDDGDGDPTCYEDCFANDNYGYQYRVNDESIRTNPDLNAGERRTAIGVYDGSTYSLYLNGEKLDEKTHNEEVDMAYFLIGANAPGGNTEFLDGEIYEIRLYHDAFNEDEVSRINTVME